MFSRKGLTGLCSKSGGEVGEQIRASRRNAWSRDLDSITLSRYDAAVRYEASSLGGNSLGQELSSSNASADLMFRDLHREVPLDV